MKYLKYAVIALMCALMFIDMPYSAYEGCGITERLLFHFYHANVWHLAANAMCIHALQRIRWVESYVISFLCSFVIIHPTVGISGLLFAAVGMNIGMAALPERLAKCLLFSFLCGLLPGVSMLFHILTLTIGYAYGWSVETYRVYRRSRLA